MTLHEIMTLTGSDKAQPHHNYCPFYSKFFEKFRGEVITLLELGIGGENTLTGGASLKGWLSYFEKGIIAGVDIYDKSFLEGLDERLFIYRGSQDDPVFLSRVMEDLEQVDIIIDDCSHVSSLTIKSFEILFPVLKSGGLYCIEDLSTSYRLDFEGSHDVKNEDTTMGYLIKMLHNLNRPEIGFNYERVKKWEQIEAIHFYPELVIIKKK